MGKDCFQPVSPLFLQHKASPIRSRSVGKKGVLAHSGLFKLIKLGLGKQPQGHVLFAILQGKVQSGQKGKAGGEVVGGGNWRQPLILRRLRARGDQG